MIKAMFTIDDLQKDLDEFLKVQNNKLAMAMANAAVSVVNEAKNNASYHDITSNLRSSTGFRVYNSKKIVEQLFEGKNSEGIEKSKSVASGLNNTDEPHLIILAGMKYAQDVEERGRTVLSDFIDADKILKDIKYIVE